MKVKLTYLSFFLSALLSVQVYAQIEGEGGIPQDSIPNPESQKIFEVNFFQALSERGIENYEKAINILTKIEEDTKDEAVVYFQLGLNYLDLEQFEKALSNLEKARALRPDDFDITEAVFKVRKNQKQFQSAIDEALILAGKNPEYFEVVASMYLELQNFEKALFYLDMSDQALGYSAGKDGMREQIYKSYNNPEEAIKYYKRREAEEPYNPLNLFRLAYFQSENKQYDDALISLEFLKEKHPLFTRAFVLETDIHLKNDQPDQAFDALQVVVSDRFLEETYKIEAIEYVKIFVEANPEYRDRFIELLNLASEKAEDSATNLDLGLYYFETDKPKSLYHFKKALEQNPQDFEILKRISILEYQLGNYNDALKTAENALEIYPAQAVFMLVKSNVFIAQAQYNEAKLVLEEAQSYIFEENEVMLMLYNSFSMVYEALGDAEKARNFKNKAEKLKSKLN
jgi:tetratricopeptide (TPR) repeat protein